MNAKAKNIGSVSRKGAVKRRSQTHNHKTNSWVERDTNTSKFINDKTSSNKLFKSSSSLVSTSLTL